MSRMLMDFAYQAKKLARIPDIMLHLLNCVINAGGRIDEGKIIAVPTAVLGNKVRLNNSRMPACQHAQVGKFVFAVPL